MSRTAIFAFCLAIVCGATAAFAVPSGKSVEFTGSPLGTVTFNGDIHKKAAGSCSVCHAEGIFPKKQGAIQITMKDIIAGRYCGICHNGVKAFEAKANCERCHIKKQI